MKTHFNYFATVALAALSSALLFSACEDTDYPSASPATTPSTNQARFLFVNAAPDAPSLNFFVENTSAGQSLSAGQAATTYVPSQVGAVQLRSQAASGAIGGVLSTSAIVFRAGATNQTNFAAMAGTAYTVFAVDTINRPRPTAAGATNPGGPQLVVATDPLSQTLTAGAGGVRFFHFAPDLGLPASTTATTPPAASIRLSSINSTTGTTSTVVTVTNRTYRAVTPNTFTPVAAGTYRVELFSGATITPTATPVASSTVTVDATKLYTLYAQGLARRRTVSVGRIQHN